MRFQAVADHQIPDRQPIKIRPGDRVRVGDHDTHWPAFVFVTTDDGEGRVPEWHLDAARPVATVIEQYDTQELPVARPDVTQTSQIGRVYLAFGTAPRSLSHAP